MASIKKNFAYNILLNISSILFPLVTAPYIARVLEPGGLGMMHFAMTYAGYYTMFAALGASTYGTREIAKRRESLSEKQLFFSGLISVLILNTFILTVIYISSLFIFSKFEQNINIFLIAGIPIIFVPFGSNWYFGGLEKFGFITSRNLIIRFLTIVCMFIFVKTKSDLYIYMLLGVISQLGGILWNWSQIKKDGIKFRLNFSDLHLHYKPMIILFSSSVAISIYTMLDTLMLGMIKDYNEVGYYNSASTIAKMSLSVVTSLSSVALPRVAYYFHKRDYTGINILLSKSYCIVAFLAFPMAIGISCISPWFVPLFLGEAFKPATLPLIIMSGVIIAIGFNNITGIQTLLGLGEDKKFLYCILIGTGVNFILNIILIPLIGANGAASSSVIAEFIILTAMLICIHKYTPIRVSKVFPDIAKSLLISLLFIPITFGLSLLLNGWSLVVSVIITCVITYAVLQKICKSIGYIMLNPVIKDLLSKLIKK